MIGNHRIVFNFLNTGIGSHLEMGQTCVKKETRTKITIGVSFMRTTMIHKQHKADVNLLKLQHLISKATRAPTRAHEKHITCVLY